MSKVLLAGSYDPVTNGHMALIRQCAKLFDEVHVVVFINAEKSGTFTIEQRKQMLEDACRDYPNVITGSDPGLVVDYAARNDIKILVRGIRGEQDLAYEMQMAKNNRTYSPNITTFFLPADNSLSRISSSEVRERIQRGEDITDLVPDGAARLIERIQKKDCFPD